MPRASRGALRAARTATDLASAAAVAGAVAGVVAGAVAMVGAGVGGVTVTGIRDPMTRSADVRAIARAAATSMGPVAVTELSAAESSGDGPAAVLLAATAATTATRTATGTVERRTGLRAAAYLVRGRDTGTHLSPRAERRGIGDRSGSVRASMGWTELAERGA
jgi:hypothetical protein